MKKPLLFILFALSLSGIQPHLYAQDSSHLRISLLTCTPGDELYALFGHSALRVIDSSSVQDNVFNYGTFNFDDKNFYLKFLRGKLLYFISVESFEDFEFTYQSTGRVISEQILNLSAPEKISLYQKLIDNLKEENRYYKYDFFYDNCTTRLRDLIIASKTPHPVLPAAQPTTTTFREAIHDYLNRGKQNWSKFGIDILLGVRTDHVMTAHEQEFLPDNLMIALDKYGSTLVSPSKELYQMNGPEKSGNWFTPVFLTVFLLLIYVGLSFSNQKKIGLFLTGLDGLLFFVVGLIGCILIFMWFYTDHSMTKDNYNLLWAWPTHLIAAFFISNKGKIMRLYWWICCILMSLVFISWFFLPQSMNHALLPVVLLIVFRSAMRLIASINYRR